MDFRVGTDRAAKEFPRGLFPIFVIPGHRYQMTSSGPSVKAVNNHWEFIS